VPNIKIAGFSMSAIFWHTSRKECGGTIAEMESVNIGTNLYKQVMWPSLNTF